MDKNKIYTGLIRGDKLKCDTKYKEEIRARYNDIMIARTLHITIYEVRDLPSQYYNDIILVLNKEAAMRKIQNDKNKRAADRRKKK